MVSETSRRALSEEAGGSHRRCADEGQPLRLTRSPLHRHLAALHREACSMRPAGRGLPGERLRRVTHAVSAAMSPPARAALEGYAGAARAPARAKFGRRAWAPRELLRDGAAEAPHLAPLRCMGVASRTPLGPPLGVARAPLPRRLAPMRSGAEQLLLPSTRQPLRTASERVREATRSRGTPYDGLLPSCALSRCGLATEARTPPRRVCIASEALSRPKKRQRRGGVGHRFLVSACRCAQTPSRHD